MLIRNDPKQSAEYRFGNLLAVYQKRIFPPTNPSPCDNTSKIPSIKPWYIGTMRNQQTDSSFLAVDEFIEKSKWVRRKFWSFSNAFWFGHGLIYQEMGILRQSAFDPACLRRICLGRQGCEKRIRSGSILSETTDRALERARGYRICTGKQHLFTKLPSGY